MELDTKQLWENTLTNIELSISPASFKMWFGETHIVRIEDGVVFVGVPNQLTKEWVSERFGKLVLKTIRGFVDTLRGVEYIVSKESLKRVPEKVIVETRPESELPLSDYYINRSDNLNPRYTFDTFVVGPFNELAFTAGQVVVKNPGIAYNPLFVYGETGRGKTHLTQAVGNQIKKAYPSKKVFYLTAERFGFEFMNAINNRSIPSFKDKYRSYDVLIIDDIQFFSKKGTIQEEFFHLFNTLHDANKQIVCSSDKHPNLIPDITERLKSRFIAGMAVAINEPDHESRMAIIKTKAESMNLTLSDLTIENLSIAVPGNIREIEGMLNTILCQIQLKGTLSEDQIKDLIKTTARPKRAVSVKHVISRIAEFYNIDEASMYAKTRRREVVRPRQIMMYILREDFHLSYPAIGTVFGGRDHTTVIHACEKVRGGITTDTDLKTQIEEIRGMLK
ncbi:MAG: chromosomal replication initiator protein DnaA [Parcubacteria group bacterium Greene0714_7]|nr:chromosomal replication initiator protein DnaA [Candidatus Paceibacterota bacterium]MBP9832335.1 chromosomal replication initiator protein DnaA [Candidatus Paceibacterota bacterium]TSD05731.1 MAG: chromosomal replication initiator protein DnaA [Parcubacteria group bacterium Greene0714_7]